MSEEKSLTKQIKAVVPKPIGIHKKLVESKLNAAASSPEEMPERIGLVFDDSTSMCGKPIEDARLATDEFIKNCNMNTTSLCIYPMSNPKRPLTTNYPLLGMEVSTLRAIGGTPTWSTLAQLIAENNITRAVLFSDGGPTDGSSERYPGYGGYGTPADVISQYVEKKIPIDTVYIGPGEGDNGYICMKHIAEDTGGIFIHFKDSDSLRKGLKYLAPAFRGMLMNAEVKERLQKGELK